MSATANSNTQKRKRTKIRRELPPMGTMLVGKFKGQVYNAEIVVSSTEHNRRLISIQGREFSSLSAAAVAVTGHSVNGWVFWKLKDKS